MNILEAVDHFESHTWKCECPIDLIHRGQSLSNQDAWVFTAAAIVSLTDQLEDAETRVELVEAFEYGSELLSMGVITSEQVLEKAKVIFVAFAARAEQDGVVV